MVLDKDQKERDTKEVVENLLNDTLRYVASDYKLHNHVDESDSSYII